MSCLRVYPNEAGRTGLRRGQMNKLYVLVLASMLLFPSISLAKDCCDEDVRFCPGYQEPDKPDPPRPDPSPPAPAPTNEPTVISEPSRPDPTPTEPTGPSPVSTDERPSISNPGLPEGKEGREEVKQSICEEWVKGLWFLKKCVRWR